MLSVCVRKKLFFFFIMINNLQLQVYAAFCDICLLVLRNIQPGVDLMGLYGCGC